VGNLQAFLVSLVLGIMLSLVIIDNPWSPLVITWSSILDFRSSLVIFGHLRAFFGHRWSSLVIIDNPWSSLVIFGQPW
jgi:hypothetical protein